MIITEGITLRGFRREHQKLILGHRQPELFSKILVVVRRLVSRAAGAVESVAGADARRRDVAAVLAREGVAGSAPAMGVVAVVVGLVVGGGGRRQCGGGEEGG